MNGLRTEREIISSWNGATTPIVTICCITYNQQDYLHDAIHSFLAQRTDFPFEVLIHDDASTDKTVETIRRYQQLYPAIIRPIYQRVNQFRVCRIISPKFVFPKAKGDFIAMCEGDDYWADPIKLQKQYDALIRFTDVDLCFHPAEEYRNEKFHKVINKYYDNETLIPVGKVISGGGGYMPTASLLIRKSAIYPVPSWVIAHAPVGDTFIQALGSARGGALYLPDAMSIYRRFSKGSITSENISGLGSPTDIRKAIDGYIECYKKLGDLPGIKEALATNVFGLLNKSVISCACEVSANLICEYRKQLDLTVPKQRLLVAMSSSCFALAIYSTLLKIKRRFS